MSDLLSISDYFHDVVERTASTSVYPNNISFQQYCKYIDFLYNFADLTDKLKSSLFYGKQHKQFSSNLDSLDSITLDQQAPYVSSNANSIHALLGIISESCELLQNIIERKENYDSQNIAELGDLTWFYTLLISSMSALKPDLSLDDFLVYVRKANKAKLLTRYPQGFNSQSALNRNTEAEDLAVSNTI